MVSTATYAKSDCDILLWITMYRAIPVFRTSKGNENWFENSGSAIENIGSKITVFDFRLLQGIEINESRIRKIRIHWNYMNYYTSDRLALDFRARDLKIFQIGKCQKFTHNHWGNTNLSFNVDTQNWYTGTVKAEEIILGILQYKQISEPSNKKEKWMLTERTLLVTSQLTLQSKYSPFPIFWQFKASERTLICTTIWRYKFCNEGRNDRKPRWRLGHTHNPNACRIGLDFWIVDAFYRDIIILGLGFF